MLTIDSQYYPYGLAQCILYCFLQSSIILLYNYIGHINYPMRTTQNRLCSLWKTITDVPVAVRKYKRLPVDSITKTKATRKSWQCNSPNFWQEMYSASTVESDQESKTSNKQWQHPSKKVTQLASDRLCFVDSNLLSRVWTQISDFLVRGHYLFSSD